MSLHKIIVSGLNYGQTHQNVIKMRCGPGLGTPIDIANDIVTNWINKVKVWQSSSYRWTNVLVRNLDDPNLAPFSLAVNILGASFNSVQQPPMSAYVVKIQTAHAGKHGRGRWHVGGVTNDSQQEGLYTATFQTNFNAQICAHWNTVYVAGQGREIGIKEDHGEGDFFPATNFQLRPTVGAIQRRKVGRGI
jgi:hypothetical protein